jgi:hypothetical protein
LRTTAGPADGGDWVRHRGEARAEVAIEVPPAVDAARATAGVSGRDVVVALLVAELAVTDLADRHTGANRHVLAAHRAGRGDEIGAHLLTPRGTQLAWEATSGASPCW